MEEKNLKHLKEVLSIPTKTWKEDLMIEYLSNYCDNKGYNHWKDKNGSVYVTKGNADMFPCVVAHIDTVHEPVEMVVNEEMLPNAQGEDKLSLKAYEKKTGRPTGIGGDDKAGVFICLKMLEQIDNIKAFFPVAEETGCHGSSDADKDFFKDVGYAIQFDSTENNTMSLTLMGVKLFEEDSEFFTSVKDIILEHGLKNWYNHPYTDTMRLKEKFDFSCLNFAAGYYNYHTVEEYVVVEDVQNTCNMAVKVIDKLGENKYTYVHKKQLLKEYEWNNSEYEDGYDDDSDEWDY
jgi:tripeptide aminopeptidase|tara:strand:+ start:1534 stop:2406 length:873 start_codon:yes stop_codon:yes gene_type:complete